ncbi:MAG TPA: hemerythrin domain-containing protein [Mycobacteriales bacterium]|jgi:hypothetical protein|nr:hemerythrin domain-containing protein [Mycobacteriales bacterium]
MSLVPSADDPEGCGVDPTPAPFEPEATAQWWDESQRPTVGPSPSAVTYSVLGRDVAQHLVDVHDHFRSELNQLLDLLEQLRGGLIGGGQARSFIAGMTIRQNSWTVGAYCASYCRMLTQHHGMEDSAIFPHLRSSEPGLAPVLDRLAEEHLVIHGILESVDAALVGHLLDPTDVSLIDQAADALARTLLSHLAYEESQLLAPLARYGFYSGQVR